ncbi:uncharacterized protein LOC115621031 [Scaptodrosophila lebanonensis]|uniref:Uncharacterized protein LOC115621031 n=1 Tax=Drosophila lebanonensis TaxID=7225 RepID=A0A6J2T563_DROLE|nr:uncharacterized protein LOC115621031 [Scaptodrosophila lebanonensis]
MRTHGLSKAKVLNSTTLIGGGQYTLGFHVQMAKIKIESEYKVKGHVLLLNLNSVGNMSAELENLEYFVALKTKPQRVDGVTFLNVSAVQTDIARIDKIRVQFSNLFGGNEELERSANELFNDNWRVLFDLLRPVLTQTYDAVLLNRFSKIFAYVPAKLLFEDL